MKEKEKNILSFGICFLLLSFRKRLKFNQNQVIFHQIFSLLHSFSICLRSFIYQSLYLFFLILAPFRQKCAIFLLEDFFKEKHIFFCFSGIFLLNFQRSDNLDILSKYLCLHISFNFRHNNNKTLFFSFFFLLDPMLETPLH